MTGRVEQVRIPAKREGRIGVPHFLRYLHHARALRDATTSERVSQIVGGTRDADGDGEYVYGETTARFGTPHTGCCPSVVPWWRWWAVQVTA